MVAQLAPERAELVSASGHLARTGTIAGGIGATVGGGPDRDRRRRVVTLVAAAVCSSSPRCWPVGFHRAPIEARVESVVIRVETPLEVRRAAPAVATIRAAEGALTFLLALSIKRGGGDQWIFVAALLAAGIGTFVGTIVSSRLQSHVLDRWHPRADVVGAGRDVGLRRSDDRQRQHRRDCIGDRAWAAASRHGQWTASTATCRT